MFGRPDVINKRIRIDYPVAGPTKLAAETGAILIMQAIGFGAYDLIR